MNLNIDVKVNSENTKRRLSQVGTALTGLGRNTKATTGEFNKFYNGMKKTNNMFGNITKDANRSSATIGKLGKAMGGLNQALGVGKFYLLGSVLNRASESAMDMIEVTNLFSVSMGALAVETDSTLTSMSELMGLDPTNLRSSVGTFSLLARSMGISDKNAQTLAVNTSKLALDLASLTNIPIQQVMQDLRSGLVGQSETVYKYGIDVTEAGLKQEAMNQGITKSVRNMSQGEKMALRYATMIRQTALAQGDFARTLDTPANQMKVMQERVVTLTRAIGTLFIPTIGAVLPYLNAFFRVLTEIIQALAIMIGYQAPVVENMSNGFSAVGDEVDDTTKGIGAMSKAIKNASLGFDELNVLQKDSGSDGGEGVSFGGAEFDLKGYDNLMDKINDRSSQIADRMRKFIEDIKLQLEKLGSLFEPIVDGASDSFSKLYTDTIVPVFNNIVEVIKFAMERIYNVVIQPILTLIVRIFKDVTLSILTLWNEHGKALLLSTSNAVIGIYNWFVKLWTEYLQPAVTYLITTMKWLWDNHFKQLVDTVMKFVVSTYDNILALINNGILPMFNYLADKVLPIWLMGFKNIMDFMGTFIGFITDVAGNLITIFDGIITFLTGAFTGDWKKAWDGLGKIIVGAFGIVDSVITGIANLIIDVMNSVIRALNTVKIKIPDWVPNIGGQTFGITLKELSKVNVASRNNDQQNFSRTPRLARGGSLERGTMFEAGEFGKVEAIGSYNGKTTVMPLENTDFVKAIYDAVVSAMSDSAGNAPIVENIIQLDGDVIYKNQRQVEQRRGVDLGMGVFAR